MDFKTFNSKTTEVGVQFLHFFPNNYGVSIVRTIYSYGGKEGLWELAVLEKTDVHYKITYDTPITNDVLGYLEDDEVNEICKRIEELSPVGI